MIVLSEAALFSTEGYLSEHSQVIRVSFFKRHCLPLSFWGFT